MYGPAGIRPEKAEKEPLTLPLQFPLFSALALATGFFALAVALLLLVFFPVRRWRQHRYFFLVALAAGVFAISDFASAGPVAPALKHLLGRVQLVAAGLHVSAWAAYAGADLGPLPRWRQRAAEAVPLGLGLLLALFPSLALTGRFNTFPFRIFGAEYALSEITPLALASLGVMTGVLLAVMSRYFRAYAEGRPQSIAHLLALSVFIGCAAVDLATMGHLWALPLLTPFGVALGVIPIAMVLAARWRQDVQEHEQLSASLERTVTGRTSELTAALAALGRTEKLAAVGRLAGGMAHEINNPGAALIANLEYLELGLQRGEQLPPDVGETIHESLSAARRISRAVRQLLLLSRAAIAESEGHSFDLKLVAGQALRAARDAEVARHPPPQVSNVVFEDRIPPGLRSSGRGQLLDTALRALIEQLADSAPHSRTSRIMLAAHAEGPRVRLEVRTDFRGLGPSIREQLGESFLAPRGNDEGASFGLAASLGLLRTLGVEIVLEEHTAGTTVALLLDAAPPAPDGPLSPPP